MIKNDKQFAITKMKRDEFLKSLAVIEESSNNDLLKQVMLDAAKSQLETFDREIVEYEQLRHGKPMVISATVDELPESLIKIRIARGLSQEELALRVGVQKQQIQRYESNNYESANFERVLTIARSMEVRFDQKKVLLDQLITVEGYDPVFLKNATNRLQSKRRLLTI